MMPMDILRDRDYFLGNFEPRYRSTAANTLLNAVRQGCTTPEQVVDRALDTACRRIHGSDAFTLIICLAEEDPEALLAGARWALWYESLPFEQRQKMKNLRSADAVARWMQTQPPTEKQMSYLRILGYTGEVANKLEASRLIEQLKGRSHV